MAREQLKLGIKMALPIVIGYVPLGLAFGVLAGKAGLSPWEAMLMSVLVYSGSGQFIAISLWQGGAPLAGIIGTVLVVNLRYLLFSASLAPRFQKLSRPLQALLAAEITDESYAVSVSHLDRHPADQHYLLGLYITAHLAWVSSSCIGAAAGNLIPNIEAFGVNFALPAMFIALLVMQVKNKTAAWVAVVGGILSLALASVTRANVIIATIVAAALGVALEGWNQKSSGLSSD